MALISKIQRWGEREMCMWLRGGTLVAYTEDAIPSLAPQKVNKKKYMTNSCEPVNRDRKTKLKWVKTEWLLCKKKSKFLISIQKILKLTIMFIFFIIKVFDNVGLLFLD